VHQGNAGGGGHVVTHGGAHPARRQGAHRPLETTSARGRLHHHVVASAPGPGVRGVERTCASSEGLGDATAFGIVVEVVDLGGSQGHGDPGGVQADALGAAAQYQHCATGPLGQGSGHGPPCVGEVVTGGGDPWGGDVLRHRDEHVV